MSRYCLFLLIFVSNVSCNRSMDYSSVAAYSQDKNVNAIIEIPAGTNEKIEYNKTSKTFEIDKKNGQDRIIEFLPYIGNYGYIPSTFSDPKKGGDGDALDILLLSQSLPTGTIVEVLPIGMLKLIDAGEIDYKIIAIPSNKNDQIIKTESFLDFSKKHPKVKLIIEEWFLNYNKEDKANIEGWSDEIAARLEIDRNKIE